MSKKVRYYDPCKLTLLTPGFDRKTGAMKRMGAAPIVAQYLRENRVVPEKNDLNSLLFLLTPGSNPASGNAGQRAGCVQASS